MLDKLLYILQNFKIIITSDCLDFDVNYYLYFWSSSLVAIAHTY